MKRMTRIACLLLSVLLLVGCASGGQNSESTAAPETSGAVLATEPAATEAVLPTTAEKTEQAIARI